MTLHTMTPGLESAKVRSPLAEQLPCANTSIGDDALPGRSTNAQFMSRKGVWAIAQSLRAASALSPRLGGRLAYEILSRPPRFKAREREQSVYQSAKHSFIHLGQRRIKIYEWGEGPTVLLIHCWGGRATQQHALIESIVADGYRVVSFDGPAHGESGGRRTDMFDFSEVATAVANRIGALDAVVAHSFGAAAALIGHRMYALRARRYVLISMFRSCEWFVDAFGQYFSVRPHVLEHMIAGFNKRRSEPVNWSELNMVRIIGDIEEPVLLVHDQDDREIPFDHAELLHRAAPHATLHVTRGLGHRRILRDPQAIAQIQSFLSKR